MLIKFFGRSLLLALCLTIPYSAMAQTTQPTQVTMAEMATAAKAVFADFAKAAYVEKGGVTAVQLGNDIDLASLGIDCEKLLVNIKILIRYIKGGASDDLTGSDTEAKRRQTIMATFAAGKPEGTVLVPLNPEDAFEIPADDWVKMPLASIDPPKFVGYINFIINCPKGKVTVDKFDKPKKWRQAKIKVVKPEDDKPPVKIEIGGKELGGSKDKSDKKSTRSSPTAVPAVLESKNPAADSGEELEPHEGAVGR